MREVWARKNYDEKYKEGFPLLLDTYIFEDENSFNDGELFVLLDHKSNFIAKG